MKYILIADDEPMNQCVFEEMLTDEYRIHTVDNGQECLESIEESMPDLLLLDVAMPVMDGIEVCRRLRADTKTRFLPIILISAYASERDVEVGMTAGADLYIAKPFNLAKVRADIAEILRTAGEVKQTLEN